MQMRALLDKDGEPATGAAWRLPCMLTELPVRVNAIDRNLDPLSAHGSQQYPCQIPAVVLAACDYPWP